ncbi:protein of unknown function [Actinopolymorpha cephalotaxi]|uniref:Uncharacterized protein n=1 Tax=Actinopolymorpha cephalotaxi TaxID=504797 RepID=A0A1I2ZSC2_9ACTN|nr:DUF3472 domain-containing protein [Actinopolymorpha cephalotaxi]NYH84142.1 hypothetical protein [Actinopolymorpha cephalotaxi]SFH40708.1 protein of unknown function [Actinopolymorpha cephalotaxi]
MPGVGRLARLGVAAGLAVGVVAAGLAGSGPAAASRGDSLDAIRNNVSITDAGTHQRGQLDSAGSSFRASAIAAAGYGPGADVDVDGLDFTMPDVAAGEPDNFTPSPAETTIGVSGSGNAIAFLGTAGGFSGLDLTVHYTDRSSKRLWVGMPAYTKSAADPLHLSTIATTVAGRNTAAAPDVDLGTDYAVFMVGVNIDPSKTVRSLTMASIGSVHLYDLRVVTVGKPFAVDSVLGRTPQPEDDGVPCDPRVEGKEACGPFNYWENADPSTHLRYFPASGVVPEGATAFYNEITVQSSVPSTYFMTNGYSGGYYGIQQLDDGSKIAIFSIFGPNRGTVPDDRLTSKVLYRIGHGDFVIHGEYAGGPSIRIPFDWKVGRTYATMITNQPDATRGNHAQIVTAWLNTEPIGRRPNWLKLMTVRTERPSATPLQLTGLYSFLEDFLRDGSFTEGRVRQAAYSNAAIYHAGNGWRPLNRIGFTGQLSGKYTIQNDAYPTPGETCAITEKITGGDIPFADVRSGYGTIWDTSRCDRPRRLPADTLAPLGVGAPIQQATTFLDVEASASGDQLSVSTELLADDEPVRVSVDGKTVSAADLAASPTGTLDVRIALPGPLAPGEHTVEVSGRSSNLTGSTTVIVK